MKDDLIIDGLFRDTPAPDYIVIDGHSYERLDTTTESIQFDMDEESEKNLAKIMESGEFVNKQDAIRHVVRTMMKDPELTAKLSSKTTKKIKNNKK